MPLGPWYNLLLGCWGTALVKLLTLVKNYWLGGSVWVLCRLPEQKARSEQAQETELFSFCLACVESSFFSKGLDMFCGGSCHNPVLMLPGALLGAVSHLLSPN